MNGSGFVYPIYVRATPEAVWRALTDPALTRRYWGAGLHSDWRPGSPVRWQYAPDGELHDMDQVVLVAEPCRRLAYTWHNYQPEHAEFFGWSEAYLAELSKEPRSAVGFEIEPRDAAVVRLTLTHDGFAGDTEMLRACSGRNAKTGGWPEILSNLKTLLETGATLDEATLDDATH